MNIGIFSDTYHPQINGVATSIIMLKNELTKRGHKVYIFTPSDPKAEKNQPGIFRLPSMPFVFLPSNRMAMLYPPKLLIQMKKFKLDIIHTQTEFPLGIFGKLVSEFYRIPLVHTYHTMYEDYVHYIAKGLIVSPKMAQRYSRIFCNRARAVIAPAEKAKNKLESYGVIRPIYVVPTGLDFQPFSRENYSDEDRLATKAELALNPDDPIMLSVGRIAKEKSLDVLINQMPQILQKMPDLKFVIIGDGQYKDTLMDLTKKLEVESSVIFAGSRPWNVIGKYYQIGDVFVCASTSETQGLTYIEAMAAGVPVVAKKDPSVGSIITHGVTGFYFEKNDDAADIICQAFSDSGILENISKNALESIKPLSLEYFGDSLEEIYTEVINNDKQYKLAKKDKKLNKKKPFGKMFIKDLAKKITNMNSTK